MNVLLIGGSGAIGTVTAQRLAGRGHQVTIVSTETGWRCHLCDGVRHVCINRRHASFADCIEANSPPSGFDVVIDFICYGKRDASSVLEIKACRKAKVIMLSTTYLYDEDAELPHSPSCRPAPVARLGGYASGKVAAETAYLRAGDRPVVVIRLPHVLASGRSLGIVPLHNRDASLLSRILSGMPLLLAGDGYQLIQTIWHEDAAEAVLRVAEGSVEGGIFNVAHGEILTARHYYALIADALQVQMPEVLEVPIEIVLRSHWGWARSVFSRIVDCSAFQERFGWQPPTSASTAIAACVESLIGGVDRSQTHDGLRGLVSFLGGSHDRLLSAVNEAARLHPVSDLDRRMNKSPLPDYQSR